jgi:maltose alpha-D-glucosyltransferase/alpha-amylase
VLFLHNLSDQPQTVSVPARDSDEPPLEFFSDQEYAEPDLDGLELGPYGYRWLRLRRTHARW